ncbi:MAG: hypothetical protein ACREM1_07425 [Longimicrobiales bacterium]
MMRLSSAIRRERTRLELERLKRRIASWYEHRRAADTEPAGRYIGRHHTQLETLKSVLTAAADAFEADLDTAPDEPEGALHDRCREVDRAIVWLERFWTFYREKFDQRDDDRLRPALRAADEVVWSCYHEVMQRARQRDATVVSRPAPLAFIAPEHSPAALDSDARPRGDLTLPGDYERWSDDLRELVRTLPLPLLRLPPWCVESPWWLVFIAHEVGHHLMADLELKDEVSSGVSSAVGKLRIFKQADVNRWQRWSQEIFADAVSVMLLGEWAVRATAEVEWSTAERMVVPKLDYPAPLVRLELMAQLASRLGLDGAAGLGVFAPDAVAAAHPSVGRHREAVPPVVEYLATQRLRGIGTLAELCGFDQDVLSQDVAYWSSGLTQEKLPSPRAALGTARRVAAASFAVWAKVTTDPERTERAALLAGDGETPPAVAELANGEQADTRRIAVRRLEGTARLASNTREVLSRSGPPGTRSAFQPEGAAADVGVELCALLRESLGARPTLPSDDEA